MKRSGFFAIYSVEHNEYVSGIAHADKMFFLYDRKTYLEYSTYCDAANVVYEYVNNTGNKANFEVHHFKVHNIVKFGGVAQG